MQLSLGWIKDVFVKDEQAVRQIVPKISRTNSTIFKLNTCWGKKHFESNYSNVLDNIIENKV